MVDDNERAQKETLGSLEIFVIKTDICYRMGIFNIPRFKLKCLDNKRAVRLHSDSLKIWNLTA